MNEEELVIKRKVLRFLSNISDNTIFSNDMEILEAMDYIKNTKTKFKLASNISDPQVLALAFDKFDNENYQIKIATKIHSTDTLSGDEYKETVILPQINKFYNRLELIKSFEDEKRKKELQDIEFSKLKDTIQTITIQSKTFASTFSLDLPQTLTIGIEIEAVGINQNETSELFKKLYEINPELISWKIKFEDSLNVGCEVVSPIMDSSEECVEEIYIISQTMQALGFDVDNDCGFHIHFGSDYLSLNNAGFIDEKLGQTSFTNLFNIWTEAEDLFYKMSNGEGKVLRPSGLYFADYIGPIIDENTSEEDTLELTKAFEEIARTRYSAINLQNIRPGGSNTIEFRIPNGTVDPIEMLQNIYLYGNLLVLSKDLSLSEEKYSTKLKNFKNRHVSEAEKVEYLLNLLFESNDEKTIYRKRWRSIRDEEIYKEIYTDVPKFRKGDYSLKHQLKEIAEDCTYFDKIKNFKCTILSFFNSTEKSK